MDTNFYCILIDYLYSYLSFSYYKENWLLCVCYLVERAGKIGILKAGNSSDGFAAGLNQHGSHCC